MSHRVIRALLVAGTLFGVAAGVAFATGTIKLTETVKYGCAKKNNGELRAVSDPSQCRKNERAVQFGSGSGTQGPTGPRGPAGPTGPAGPGDTPAYAHVNRDGSLDATQTKNVNGVLLLPTSAGKGDGVYCIDVSSAAMPVRNIVGTPQVNVASLGTSDEALVGARGIIPAVSQCPAPYTDATLVEVLEEQDNSGPHQFPIPFYVAFNK